MAKVYVLRQAIINYNIHAVIDWKTESIPWAIGKSDHRKDRTRAHKLTFCEGDCHTGPINKIHSRGPLIIKLVLTTCSGRPSPVISIRERLATIDIIKSPE